MIYRERETRLGWRKGERVLVLGLALASHSFMKAKRYINIPSIY